MENLLVGVFSGFYETDVTDIFSTITRATYKTKVDSTEANGAGRKFKNNKKVEPLGDSWQKNQNKNIHHIKTIHVVVGVGKKERATLF